MSVTNDIENVVADIASHEGIDPTQYLIIYRDSMGQWDGWNPVSKAFYSGPLPPEVMKAIVGQILLEAKSSSNIRK